MAEAEQGKLEIRYDSIYNDEISQLGHSFNKMIEAIKTCFHLSIRNRRQKRGGAKSLSSQIKLILYNTLDTINWMAWNMRLMILLRWLSP